MVVVEELPVLVLEFLAAEPIDNLPLDAVHEERIIAALRQANARPQKLTDTIFNIESPLRQKRTTQIK